MACMKRNMLLIKYEWGEPEIEGIVALEKLLESLSPKALPKPPLRERIRRIFKQSH